MNSKQLRPLTTTLALLSSSGLMATNNNTPERGDKERPNIIFILVDDHGKGDLACLGNPCIQTPNIDKFYADAVRFDNYHVSTSSAPSRSSIMTGRHCNRLNVFHTIQGRSIIFNDEVILPQVLAQNGYTNAMYGKWHLGDNYPNRPEDRGFHEVIRFGGGAIGNMPDYWMNDYFDDVFTHNGKEEQFEGYCTDVYFNNAMEFIEENRDNPFFCYISTNAPHSPFNVPKEYYDIYKDAKVDGEPLNPMLKRFYGMITNIDDNFKRLEDKLEELNLTENTIVIYSTDNGTPILPATEVHNAGMSGKKGSPYEGGHRVPMFIRWKGGKVDGGRDVNELVAHYDLLPTFVDLLDLDYVPAKPLDGKSLKPLLTESNPEWENRVLYMDTQREESLIKYKDYVVMDENWRLVNGKLYNINKDLAQQNDVSQQYPEVASRLKEGYERWWGSIMAENVDVRYSYIQVGSPKENPSKITSHDMHTGEFNRGYHQNGALRANTGTGNWKIEFLEDGEYKISLCRFPRESGLCINSKVAAAPQRFEVAMSAPASIKDDFVSAKMYVAGNSKTGKIESDTKEVTFNCNVPAGKYDFYAQLVDSKGVLFPAYYIYIEKQ